MTASPYRALPRPLNREPEQVGNLSLMVSSSSLRLSESNDLSNHKRVTLRLAQGERCRSAVPCPRTASRWWNSSQLGVYDR